MEEDTERAERKKKIKELEATLFGRDHEWLTRKTDLPRLQNVDEFSATFNTAEAKKPSMTLPRLKPKTKKKAKAFLQTITKKSKAKSSYPLESSAIVFICLETFKHTLFDRDQD